MVGLYDCPLELITEMFVFTVVKIKKDSESPTQLKAARVDALLGITTSRSVRSIFQSTMTSLVIRNLDDLEHLEILINQGVYGFPHTIKSFTITNGPTNNLAESESFHATPQQKSSILSVLSEIAPSVQFLTITLDPWQSMLDILQAEPGHFPQLQHFRGRAEYLATDLSLVERGNDLIISDAFIPHIRKLELVFPFTDTCHKIFSPSVLDLSHFSNLTNLCLSFGGSTRISHFGRQFHHPIDGWLLDDVWPDLNNLFDIAPSSLHILVLNVDNGHNCPLSTIDDWDSSTVDKRMIWVWNKSRIDEELYDGVCDIAMDSLLEKDWSWRKLWDNAQAKKERRLAKEGGSNSNDVDGGSDGYDGDGGSNDYDGSEGEDNGSM
ncbi:hypothetical protein VKT23_007800 [Stygiomarasmius scandens]|uniref:Uncharacterized protein n=1 Tax=Marasmiellus scandens TaxID=2682957 RepID=A0ABR1JJL1_9AGAR